MYSMASQSLQGMQHSGTKGMATLRYDLGWFRKKTAVCISSALNGVFETKNAFLHFVGCRDEYKPPIIPSEGLVTARINLPALKADATAACFGVLLKYGTQVQVSSDILDSWTQTYDCPFPSYLQRERHSESQSHALDVQVHCQRASRTWRTISLFNHLSFLGLAVTRRQSHVGRELRRRQNR